MAKRDRRDRLGADSQGYSVRKEFTQALLDDFREHGVEAIRIVRIERPVEYLKIIASLVPKLHSDSDGDPLRFSRIEWVIVPPGDRVVDHEPPERLAAVANSCGDDGKEDRAHCAQEANS
jgi:hypothetical protein